MHRGTAVLGLAALLAIATAQPASATIVYEHDNQIWAMNDDGSDQRALATPDPLGMDAGLGNPHVAPNAATVVFEGATNRNYHTCGAGVQYWGQHATGIYRWRDGAVARLSQEPTGQPTCITSIHADPEATTNGRLFNELLLNVNGTFGHGFQSGTQEGPADSDAPSACDNAVGLADPSPNPANPAQFAYLGCTGGGGQDLVGVSQGSTHTTPIGDDASQRGVAWRSDGGRLVVSEGGTEPGIWTYNPAAPVDPVRVLDGDFGDLSFAGAGNERILFASGGDIWSVPASCTAGSCTLAQATRLTTSGSNDHPSWTTAGLRPPASTTTPGGGSTTTPGGGGSTTTTPGTGSGGGAGGGSTAVLQDYELAGKPTSKKGVTFRITLGTAARVEFSFSQLKSRKFKRMGTIRKPGKAGENVFRFTKVGRKKFRKGKYRATIKVAGARTVVVPFTVKR